MITAHKSPDGDAIGSSLGLYHFLKVKGHEVTVIMPDPFPKFLKWMPGAVNILCYNEATAEANQAFESADVVFSLDYNALHRVGDMADAVAQSPGVKILIDHHQQPDDYPDYLYSDTSACSTAQLIYEFAAAMEEAHLFTADAATCMYVGIMTDSGSFRFPSTTSDTHRIVAELIDLGANNASIHEQIYDTNSENRLRMLGYILNNNFKVYREYNTVVMSMNHKELTSFNYKKGDLEGVVNYGLSLEGIRFSAFITQKDDLVKMSLRSKGDFSVNALAREHFNGGGHTNAAGGISDVSVEETVAKIESLLPQYKAAPSGLMSC